MGKHEGDTVHLTTAEDDYDVVRLSNFGAMHTEPEQHHVFDALDATAGWSALNNDTLNLATTKKHVLGTDALIFDKVDGAANTIFAAIQKTITSVDIGSPSPHDLIQTVCYIPDLTNVAYVFVRIGTDSSNYNEWRIPDTALTAAEFQTLIFNIGDANHAGITGNGWNTSAITYVVAGIAFDAETNTLVGIIFDELSFHTNQHTSAELNAEVSSSVSSANVNLQKVGGSATDKGAGNVSNGSQRVVLATDDINTAAIKTALEVIDGAIIGPGEPAIDSYTQKAINLTTGADQVLVSSAANKQIWVYGYHIMCGDADGQSVSFQDEDDVALSGIMEFAQYGGGTISPSGNFSMPIWKLGTNKDLECDITGGDVDGWISYAIVSV